MDVYFYKWKCHCNYLKIYHTIFNFPKKINYKSKFSSLHRISIDNINKLPLLECILELPENIRIKIGTVCIKRFWKEYIPITNKVPSWYSYKNYVERELFKSTYENIHFMHLEFNTLPQNKKYILGCQCNFCINYKKNNELVVEPMVYKQLNDIDYFKNNMSFTNTKWNDHIHVYITSNGHVNYQYIFNPLFKFYSMYHIYI